MKNTTLKEIANIVGGILHGPEGAEVGSIHFDSRLIQKGELFIALPEATPYLHSYAESAKANGAAAALVPSATGVLPEIVVPDTYEAFLKLAAYCREQLTQTQVIALTGSVGKTSTKEMLGRMLQAFIPTFVSYKNFNNHLGVPFNVVNTPPSMQAAVYEAGMNHPGEISPLSQMLQPHIALITEIAPVHIEAFENEEGIAAEKCCIFDGMQQGGTAIINSDSKHYNFCLRALDARGIKNIMSFGLQEWAHVRATILEQASTHTVLRITSPKTQFECKTNFVTEGYIRNLLACVAAVEVGGYDVTQLPPVIETLSYTEGRGQTYDCLYNNKTFTLVDDAYNASPLSVKEALLKVNSFKQQGLSVYAVLADMKELGPHSHYYHTDYLAPLLNNVEHVFLYGEAMSALAPLLPGRATVIVNLNDFAKELLAQVPDNAAVLIKGSNSMGLSTLVKHIVNHCSQRATT